MGKSFNLWIALFVCIIMAGFAGSAAAYPVTFSISSPQGAFDTDVYPCTDSTCTVLGSRIADLSGNPNTYSVSGSGTKYFAEFDTKECFMPKAFIVKTESSTGVGPWSYSLSFSKLSECHASMYTFEASDYDIMVGDTVQLTAIMAGMMEFQSNQPLPPSELMPFYSGHVDTFLYVQDTLKASKTLDIPFGQNGTVTYDYTFTAPGTYVIKLYTKMDNECKCSSSIWRHKELTIIVREPEPYCGDGIKGAGEQCELPDTFNNAFCTQSTSTCQGRKTGTRDLLGNCDSECGCVQDPFTYQCIVGSCMAECAVDADCDDQNPNTADSCQSNCLCEHDPIPHCGDGIIGTGESCELPSTTNNINCIQAANTCLGAKKGIRDPFGDCSSSCGCVEDPFTYSCVQGQCGAQCATNADCNDFNPNTIDTCNIETCGCSHIPQQFCGDGIVNASLGESCELPGTSNNAFCSQTTTQCNGVKLGVRDTVGYCSAGCGCVDDPFTYQCVEDQCGATCDADADCAPKCVGNLYYYSGDCDMATTCSCGYQIENCDLKDGWYDTGDTKWISTGICTEKQQKKQEYRNYVCSIDGCTYNTCTEFRWIDTGLTGNMPDGTTCNDGLFCTTGDICLSGTCTGPSRDCSMNSFSEIAKCNNNPDNKWFTWDYSAGFTSVCDETHDICTTSTRTFSHTCDMDRCDAGCESDADCNDQNPFTSDSCNLSTCSCEHENIPHCGDGIKDAGESCELPGTTDNSFCSQSLTTCSGKKLGTRDAFGNCDSACGCVQDNFNYQCVVGQCGATCSMDSHCDDGNPATLDYCTDGCTCRHDCQPICGDGVLSCGMEQCELPNTFNNNNCAQTTTTCSGVKTGVRDAFGDCSSTCGCTQDPFTYQCMAGSCGAQCGQNSDCNDGNPNTIDTCNIETCGCSHVVQPYCGDAQINPGEQCELPGTSNNIYCIQSTSTCNGNKTGTRDPFGACDSACGCVQDNFNFQCVKNSCGAQCSADIHCNDGNSKTVDTCDAASCTCKHVCVPTCGDGIMQCGFGESCELPNTNNNVFCPQTTSTCEGAKYGTRDLFGNCNSNCGCASDSFTFQCSVGHCGAECSNDGHCNDGNPNTSDTCNTETCGCTHTPITPDPYCGDGLINLLSEQCELPGTANNAHCCQSTSVCEGKLTGTRDMYGDCSSGCGCVFDSFNFQCSVGSCGAECSDNGHCDDENSNTIDTCTSGCLCNHEPINECEPINEVCDGLDNDCDGEIDEGSNICGPHIMTFVPSQDMCIGDEFGEDFVADIDAFDPDDSVLFYSLVESPSGMVIDSSTGDIDWAVSNQALGTHLVIVKAEDRHYTSVDSECPSSELPVCATNGNTYRNSCELAADGKFLWHEGYCYDLYQFNLELEDCGETPYPRRKFAIEKFSLINEDPVCAGSDLIVLLSVQNIGVQDTDDLRLVAEVPELASRISTGPFALKEGRTVSKTMMVEIPADTKPGVYDLRVYLSSGDYHRIKHRDFVVKTC